ncbi:MAG TPA: hypothetical protein VK654_12215 [Nitrospirota bacterium]|nr:hypothetical protein [Nitrospirota bacterium]
MKNMTVYGAIILSVLISSCGRYQFHAQTMARDFTTGRPVLVHDAGPVALKNGSSAAPGVEQVVCQMRSIDVNTSIFDFTNAAIGTAKSAFQTLKVAVDDKAGKSLEFTIPRVVCDSGWRFNATVTLRVRTGSGLIKEYEGSEAVSTGYQITSALETAMTQGIDQMLNDKEIAAYLGNTGK